MSTPIGSEPRILQEHPVRPRMIIRDGVLAGALGWLSVGLCHLLVDLTAGELLRTPAALYGLFSDSGSFGGVLPLGVRALRFIAAHLGGWLVAGVLASLMVSLSDAFPRLWYAACAATAFVFFTLLHAAFFLEVPGLPPLHLWLGVIIGPAVMFGWLAHRHPGVLKQFDRTALTAVGAHDLGDAMISEYRAQQRYRQALQLGPHNPVLLGAIAEKQAHIDRLLELFDRMDAVAPETPEDEPGPAPATLEEAYQEAIEQERETVEMYDRFLAAVDELKIRDVFVHLRESAEDELLPRFQEALDAQRSAAG
jgi:rubrerythrin